MLCDVFTHTQYTWLQIFLHFRFYTVLNFGPLLSMKMIFFLPPPFPSLFDREFRMFDKVFIVYQT